MSSNLHLRETMTDDECITYFAVAMKAKMLRSATKGRADWQKATKLEIQKQFYEHIAKRDPVDIANYCMMLWFFQQQEIAKDMGI